MIFKNLGIKSWLFYQLNLGKKIKSFAPASLLPQSIHELHLHISFEPFGGLSPLETSFLASLAHALNPENIFEFGTCTGLTTYNLAVNTTAAVHTLDLPQVSAAPIFTTEKSERAYMGIHPTQQHWKNYTPPGKIITLQGDSASFNYTPYLNRMQLVFVDASHTYDYVVNDSKKAFSLLSLQAALVWHDYTPCWPGVIRALNELSEKSPLYHVAGTSLVIYFTEALSEAWKLPLK